MQFISLSFLCFLLTTWVLWRFMPKERRWQLLLTASLFFIGFSNPGALLVLISSSLLTFYAGLSIQRFPNRRRSLYLFSLVLQVSCLFLLKYIESGNGGLYFLFREAGFREDVLLFAVGFSFYTLQHIAYLTDIYQKRSSPQTSALRFLLFSSFFAKFNAGPLEQTNRLIPQFNIPDQQPAGLLEGINRIALGVFKKMVLADRLAPIVAGIFNGSAAAGSAATLTGVCLFTVQLYFDFSAYSDIAIGSAKLFGIELTENFDRPFTAASVSEFWRKWHISLIRWFTTSIYFPVAFRFRKQKYLAVFLGIGITFLVSGLWHGIGKTFFIWSLLHAIYLSYESLTKQTRIAWKNRFSPIWYNGMSILLTFLLVCFSNLFFRSANLSEALRLLRQLASSPFGGKGPTEGFLAVLAGGGYQEALFNFFLTISLMFVFLFLEKRISTWIRSGSYAFLQLFFLLLLIFLAGVFKHADYFIYLQF